MQLKEKQPYRLFIRDLSGNSYFLFRDNFLVFAVEIEDNIIVQASGKYNTKLTQEQTILLDDWFKIYLTINEQKVEQVA